MTPAALTSPPARRMLAMTEAPMPNISPSPVTTMKSGATILTAAIPSGPTPWPTKMPSMMVSRALNTMPTSVGKKIARKSRGMSPPAKSRLS